MFEAGILVGIVGSLIVVVQGEARILAQLRADFDGLICRGQSGNSFAA
jgi:hypothetical protein